MTKGKAATKGRKQIFEENRQTLNFYLQMTLASNAAHLLVLLCVFSEFGTFEKVSVVLSGLVHTGCYRMLLYMARARHSPDGQLIDAGLDLNMEAGFSEHVKDVIILTSACQLGALVSRYFWLLWLFVPFRCCHLAWKHVIGPYMMGGGSAAGDTAAQQEQMHEADRKQRKMARKLKYSTPAR